MTGTAIERSNQQPVSADSTAGAVARSAAVADLVEASISPNTRRAYQAALARFDAYMAKVDPQAAALAATDDHVAAYIADLHAEGHAPASAAMAVAALRFRAKFQSRPSPVGPLADRALAGFRREAKDRGRGQVAGVDWQQADVAAAVAGNGGGSAQGLRDAAMLAVGSDAMLRSAEIAALRVGDVSHEADGSGRVMIRNSKTDQEGKGSVQYLGKPTADRVRAWTERAGIADQPDAPLFQRLDKAHKPRGPINAKSVRAIIKRRVAAAAEVAGIAVAGRVSGHSLRVGAAQSLARGGASLVEMQVAGRWQSAEMPARYARAEMAANGAVARLRYGG